MQVGSATFHIKKVAWSDVHRALELLGGVHTRITGGHNAVAYSFERGTVIAANPRHKAKTVSGPPLRELLGHIEEVGVSAAVFLALCPGTKWFRTSNEVTMIQEKLKQERIDLKDPQAREALVRRDTFIGTIEGALVPQEEGEVAIPLARLVARYNDEDLLGELEAALLGEPESDLLRQAQAGVSETEAGVMLDATSAALVSAYLNEIQGIAEPARVSTRELVQMVYSDPERVSAVAGRLGSMLSGKTLERPANRRLREIVSVPGAMMMEPMPSAPSRKIRTFSETVALELAEYVREFFGEFDGPIIPPEGLEPEDAPQAEVPAARAAPTEVKTPVTKQPKPKAAVKAETDADLLDPDFAPDEATATALSEAVTTVLFYHDALPQFRGFTLDWAASLIALAETLEPGIEGSDDALLRALVRLSFEAGVTPRFSGRMVSGSATLESLVGALEAQGE